MAEIKSNNNQLDDAQNAESQETKGFNFVEEIVYNDLKDGKTADDSTPVSHPNPMVICISVMPKLYAWTSV